LFKFKRAVAAWIANKHDLVSGHHRTIFQKTFFIDDLNIGQMHIARKLQFYRIVEKWNPKIAGFKPADTSSFLS